MSLTQQEAVTGARVEMKIRLADGVEGETDVFPDRIREVVSPATIELNEAIGQEMLPEEVGQSIVVGLLLGWVEILFELEFGGGRNVWPSYHVPEIAAAAVHELDLDRVWECELGGNGRLVWSEGVQGNARWEPVPRHQGRRAFGGQKGHEAHGGIRVLEGCAGFKQVPVRFCVGEQVDNAVDLGVVPAPLPEIGSLATDDTDEHRLF